MSRWPKRARERQPDLVLAPSTLWRLKVHNQSVSRRTNHLAQVETHAVSKFAVDRAAAGKSSRFHDKNYKKPFAPLANRAVWLHSAERFLARDDVKQFILVISPEDREYFHFKFGANVAILGIDVVDGGRRAGRFDRQGAWRASSPTSISSAVHDAARPCLADEWITSVFDAAEKSDAAILAIPVAGTLKRVGADHTIEETVSRAGLWEAQTPQVFRRKLLLEAHAKRGDFAATDDAQLVERIGHARDGRARLADESEDHHARRSAAGRAGAQGAAQAEVHRPGPSVRRRRHVAVSDASRCT